MVFPTDVYRRAVNSRKLLAQDKAAIITQLFIVGNIGCFFVLRFVFRNILGIGTGWAIIVQLILFISLGIFLFRFFIFKEDEKLQEQRGEESDSFARFLYVKKDNNEEKYIKQKRVSVFEFTNGCVAATMMFKFGSNTDSVATSTRAVLEEIYSIICRYNFKFRTITGPEIFSESEEFKRHVKQINSIKNKKLSLHLRTISNASITIANNESNSDAFYLELESRIPGDKEQLEHILVEIIKLLQENITCFRSFEFLDINGLLEFYRYFYKIEAIDLAMLKAIDLSTAIDNDYSKLIQLYSLQAQDGKSYRTNFELRNEFKTKERDIQ
jgi:hypothetical protein